MKKVLKIILALVLILALSGCGEDKPTVEQVKSITVKFSNTSSEEWALACSVNSGSYLDGDQLDYDDFAVTPGGESQGALVFPKFFNGFRESSANGFESTILLLAGRVTPENTGFSIEIGYTQDLLISGEYGDTVLVEWDGEAFRRTKK